MCSPLWQDLLWEVSECACKPGAHTSLLGSDYRALSSTPVIYCSTSNSGILILNDATVEPNEMFQVLLSSNIATIAGETTATVTITDSDSTL